MEKKFKQAKKTVAFKGIDPVRSKIVINNNIIRNINTLS